ncbi:MAG: hypothetical protein RR922_02345 [Clostridia bacterium]
MNANNPTNNFINLIKNLAEKKAKVRKDILDEYFADALPDAFVDKIVSAVKLDLETNYIFEDDPQNFEEYLLETNVTHIIQKGNQEEKLIRKEVKETLKNCTEEDVEFGMFRVEHQIQWPVTEGYFDMYKPQIILGIYRETIQNLSLEYSPDVLLAEDESVKEIYNIYVYYPNMVNIEDYQDFLLQEARDLKQEKLNDLKRKFRKLRGRSKL